jgi:hypothetical protein
MLLQAHREGWGTTPNRSKLSYRVNFSVKCGHAWLIVNKQEVLLIREVGQSDVVQAVVPETSPVHVQMNVVLVQATTASCKSPTRRVLVYCGHTLHDKWQETFFGEIFKYFLSTMFQKLMLTCGAVFIKLVELKCTHVLPLVHRWRHSVKSRINKYKQ